MLCMLYCYLFKWIDKRRHDRYKKIMFYIYIMYFLKVFNKNLSWMSCGEERDLDAESEARAI